MIHPGTRFVNIFPAILVAKAIFHPGVVFYLIDQKYFVEGIVMTGMKN